MKKLILMSVMIACCFLTANAQKTVVSQNNQKVYEHPEVMPEYPGGMSAMVEFLSKNVKYPKDAAKQKVEGRVLVWFVVETDGSLTDVKVVPSLDAEAVRVVKTMPKWTPGKHNDQPVRVRFALPIVFKAK